MIVGFCAFDEKYAPWTLILVKSLGRVHPDWWIHLEAVDVSDLTLGQIMSCISRGSFRRGTSGMEGQARAAFIANQRPFWMQSLAAELKADAYVLLDADLLVRKSLPVNEFTCSDVAVISRSGILHGVTYSRLKVAAGFVVVYSSGLSILDEWTQSMLNLTQIEDVRAWEWFWEQSCLWHAISNTKLRITKLREHDLISSPPFSDTAIWSANVKPDQKVFVFGQFAREVERLAPNIHSVS
jgi:hypothetical protein